MVWVLRWVVVPDFRWWFRTTGLGLRVCWFGFVAFFLFVGLGAGRLGVGLGLGAGRRQVCLWVVILGGFDVMQWWVLGWF